VPQPIRSGMLKLSGFRADAGAVNAGGPGSSSLVELRGSLFLLSGQTDESETAGEGLMEAVRRVLAGLVAGGFEDKTVHAEAVE
jgi:hypothetical protein